MRCVPGLPSARFSPTMKAARARNDRLRFARPVLSRIVPVDFLCQRRGITPEVHRIDLAARVGDEGLHSGVAVLDRVCQQREIRQPPLGVEVARPTGRRGALPRQDAVVIAVPAFADLRAFRERAFDQLAERRWRLARLGLPEQSVALTARAGEPPAVFEDAARAATGDRVFLLRIDDRAQSVDRRQLVAADAARRDFLGTGARVEGPIATASYQRNRERIAVTSSMTAFASPWRTILLPRPQA